LPAGGKKPGEGESFASACRSSLLKAVAGEQESMETTVEAGAIITAHELNNRNDGGRPQLVDVRSASEFAGGHLAGALNIPLDQVESRLADLDCHRPVVLICKSGLRSTIVCNLLQQLGRPALVLQGGTAAWQQAGFPLVRSVKTRWSLERQVRLIAGLLVATGALLALLVDIRWAFLSGFVGLGLTFAGVTDFCAMGKLLERMPWNRAGKQTSRPRCCSS
jgi:rhodanese-related sulfurtransferase